MKTSILLAALAAVAALSAGVAVTVDASAQEVEMIELEGSWETTQFLGLVAKQLDINFLYDPQAPQIRGRRIEISGKATLAKSEFFDWARSVLFTHRLVLVEVGLKTVETWSVQDLNSPMITQKPVYVEEKDIGDWQSKDGAYIATTITLEHLKDTSRIRNALAQLSTRAVGRINDVPKAHSFVICDFAPVVYAQYQLIRKTDEAAAKAGPDRMAAEDPLIKSYEQKLAQCHTGAAAKYFVERIAALRPKHAKK